MPSRDRRAREHLPLRTPEHRVARRAVPYWALRELLAWGAAWLLVRWLRSSVPGWFAVGPVTAPWVPEVVVWLDRLGVVVLVVGLVAVVVTPPMRYQIHRWQTDAETVYARDGLLRVAWRITPTSRVQAVQLRRNPLEMLLRLSTVVVSSASSSGPTSIVGLDRDQAAVVAAELERAAAREPGEAT